MKNSRYEQRKIRRIKHYAMPAIVTRPMLIRAFSAPHRTHAEVMDIVNQYIDDSITPPIWGRLGVRGTFGRGIQRQWSKHIKHLSPSRYRSETGRWLTPIVQSIHDYEHKPLVKKTLVPAITPDVGGMIFDEFGTYFPITKDWVLNGLSKL